MSSFRSSIRGWLAKSANRERPTRYGRRGWKNRTGRTFPTNGVGSDHGWGSHALILGGAVNGGQIYGAFPTLALAGPDDSGNRGTWVPSTSVDQYGATLAKWFGVTSQADLDYVFPNLHTFGYQGLGFMGS